jgi:hypothetical protein
VCGASRISMKGAFRPKPNRCSRGAGFPGDDRLGQSALLIQLELSVAPFTAGAGLHLVNIDVLPAD